MTEVGSMQIGGSVDTQNIEAGLSRVEMGLKDVGVAGNSVNADFIRINQQTKELGKNLKIVATVGSAAIIGLAKGAPAVAGAMANMKVSIGKLTRSLGEALQPAFESVSEAFQGFVGWVQQHEGTISEFTSNTINGLVLGVGSLMAAWNALSSIRIPILDIEIGEGLMFLINNFGASLIAGLITAKFLGPVPGAIAATVTNIAQSEASGGQFASIGGVVGGAVGLAAGPLGGALGLILGGNIGYAVDLFLGRQDRKATSLELEYAE